MRREGGRRIGLCSRIRLSAPVVRSPAPPSRDTPRPPPPYVLRFTGFLHSTTPPPSIEGGGEGGRGKEGGGNRTIDRSVDPLPIETVSISKICRVSRGRWRSWPWLDVWETRGKTGNGAKKASAK